MTPKQIQKSRNKLGLTQEQFGALWGYGKDYICSIETGRDNVPRLMPDAIRWQLYRHENKY